MLASMRCQHKDINYCVPQLQHSYSCCRAVCSRASVSVFVVQSGRGVAALITLPLTKITQIKAKIKTCLPKSANNFFRPEGQFKNGVLNYRCHFYETLASIDWHCAHCCLASVPRATVLAGVAHGRGGVRTAGGQQSILSILPIPDMCSPTLLLRPPVSSLFCSGDGNYSLS